MKRLLIITFTDGTTKEIDLLKRASNLPIGLKHNSPIIQQTCSDFAINGYWDETIDSYIAPATIKSVKPSFTDLEISNI